MTITADMAADWISGRIKGWEDTDKTSKVIQWYMNRGICGISMDNDRIEGIALFRFLRQANDGLDPYRHDPDGAWNWIELVVVDKGVAISKFFNFFFDKYGRRPLVAYQRGLKDGKIRTYTSRMFDKMNALSCRHSELHGGLSNVS